MRPKVILVSARMHSMSAVSLARSGFCLMRSAQGARQVSSARVSRTATTHARSAISPAAIFIARAEARAILYAACVMDLHEAVDVLHSAAEASGLVDELGQDGVQAIIAEAFEAVR
jgi:hypothetical protein